MHRPALVDIAHEVNVGADRCADAARVFGLARRSRVARKRELRLHLLEALFDQCSRRFFEMIQWIRPHQRAAGVGRHPITQTAEHGAEGLAEKFSFDVPERHIDGGNRQSQDSAGPGARSRTAQFLRDGLDRQRIVADDQFAELVDRMLYRRAERAAEKAHADAFNAVFGFEPQDNELIMRTRVWRATGQRLVERDADHLRANILDSHLTLRGQLPRKMRRRISNSSPFCTIR